MKHIERQSWAICAKCDFTEFYKGYAEDFQHRHRLGPGPIHGFGEGLES